MLYWKMVRAAFTFTSVRHPTFPWFICTQASEQKRVFMQNEKGVGSPTNEVNLLPASALPPVTWAKGKGEKRNRID